MDDDIAELRAHIDRLEARLGALERERSTEPTGAPPAEAAGAGEPADARVTDRRHLLSRATTAAAGAIVGGAALTLGQASPAAAAAGTFDGDPAVKGTASPGSGTGVYGTTSSGSGVSGYSGSGWGVHGATDTGAALAGDAGPAGTALVLTQAALPPPSSSVNRGAGSLVRDSTGDLWWCITTGTPGSWRRVTGPTTAGALTLLNTPVRVYDSRPNNPPAIGPKAPLGNGSRTIDTKLNGSGVPAGATGVLANVTVVNTSPSGFLTAYKTGAALPSASTINWDHGSEIVANTTVIACDAAAQITCYVPPSSTTDFFVDIIGYYR